VSAAAPLRQPWTATVLRRGDELIVPRVTLAGEPVYETAAYRELERGVPQP